MAKKSRKTDDSAASGTAAPDAGPSRFKTSVMLAAMLFAPAAFLVLRGNLSVNEALIRFGCALLFAMVGTAIIVSSMPAPGSSAAANGSPGGPAAPAETGAPAAAVPPTPATQPAG